MLVGCVLSCVLSKFQRTLVFFVSEKTLCVLVLIPIIYPQIVNRAIVVHAKGDDMGLGNSDKSEKTGDAGDRLGCCLIHRP